MSAYCGGGVRTASFLEAALGLEEVGESVPDLSALLAMPGEEDGGRRKAGHSEGSGVVGFDVMKT